MEIADEGNGPRAAGRGGAGAGEGAGGEGRGRKRGCRFVRRVNNATTAECRDAATGSSSTLVRTAVSYGIT